jgi:hypothetical protein
MEVGKNQNLSNFFWLSTGTNNNKLAIDRILFYFRNLTNLGHFSMENPSYRSKLQFSGMDGFGKKFGSKRNTTFKDFVM